MVVFYNWDEKKKRRIKNTHMVFILWNILVEHWLPKTSTAVEELWAFCYLYCGYYSWNKFDHHFLTMIIFFLFHRLCPLVFLIFLGLKIMKITVLNSSVSILLMNVYNTTSISIFLNWSKWVLKCIYVFSPPVVSPTYLHTHIHIYKFLSHSYKHFKSYSSMQIL